MLENGVEHKKTIFDMNNFHIEQNSFESNSLDIMAPQDPIIEDSEYKDCVAKFRIGEREFHIKKHAFERFRERAENQDSKEVILEELYKLLNKSIKIQRKTGLKIFFKYKSQETQYRESDGWILVITESKFLSTCYKEE
jgi:hypothetical protein